MDDIDVPLFYFNVETLQDYIHFRDWLTEHENEKIALFINGQTIEFDDKIQRLIFILGIKEGIRIAQEGKF